MSEEQPAAPCLTISTLGWQLFENSPDCVQLLSSDGRILAMNKHGQSALAIDGFGALEGRPWASIWPAASQADVEAAIAVALGGGVGRLTGLCPSAGREPTWWDSTVTSIAGTDAGAARLLAISRDITATRQAELALETSAARFRSLAMAAGAIVWDWPARGGFQSEQPAWAGFTGQAFAEYKDDGWLAAVHPDDRAATRAAWAQALAARAVCRMEHRLRRADGAYRHMSVKAVPVVAADGAIAEWVGVHTDISDRVEAAAERERLQREVRAANDRMADIFRQAPAFMCVLAGPDHVFERVNDHYLQLVGKRDLVGLPVLQALPEIAGQGYIELLDRAYETGAPFAGHDMPVLLQLEPGMPLERRFIDLVFMALRDADGRVTGLLAHGVDQTHRTLAEAELHESRERFEKIVSQAATGVVEMDTLGRITFVNQKYADMLGYAPAELVGRSAVAVTAPDSVAKTVAAVGKLLSDGIEAAVHKHYVRKDGSWMPATSSLNALRGPDGDIHGMVAIVLDTTESERVARDLRASEERYRTLFESMDQGFCVIEMIEDEAGRAVDYRFVEVNAMFERHSGLADAGGRTIRELMPERACAWIDIYARVAHTGAAVRFEDEAKALGRWFDVYATRIGGAGSRRVALLFSDVSARRQADETLRTLAADLAEADRRKTEFLATLAHELRNPLAPIRSGLAVLRLSGDNTAAVTRVRAIMERQVGHMVHLIDDLLDIARISGDKLELKKTRADLNAVLSSAIETSLPMIETGHHELLVDLPAQPLMAEVDVTRIAQVVANLLNNAAKYTPARGTLHLAMRRDGGDALISVSDTGVGIPAEALTSVFDMFRQVGRSLDRAQGGLGIGLSLVRRLVDMHGGSVTAASAGPGAGSTFSVRLPLAPGAPAGDAAPALQPDASGTVAPGIRVLVVDDNVDAALTLSMLLEMSGHATQVAHDGVEALAVLQAFTPQLAFLDIGMPRMNGYDTAKAIRRRPELQGLTLVALTGWGAEDDRALSREAGFDHHLTKPVQLADVERILAGLG